MVAHATPNDAVLAQYFRYQREWRPNTVRLRTIQLTHLCNWLMPTALVDATEDDLIGWRDGLRGSSETVSGYVSAARGLFRWMSVRARPRLRLTDPAAILDAPRVPEREPRPMLDRNYNLALACALSDPEMYVWLLLAGCSGLRCCEIAWLRASDVEELEDGCGLLHIEGKGGKRRTVPIGEPTLLSMDSFLRTARGPVFTRPSDGGPHNPKGVSQRINAFLAGVGIRETAHTLRHRFGTDYHALDPDLLRQARLMGHASVLTTQRYTAVSPIEAARHINQLTRARISWRPPTSPRVA